MAWNYEKIKDAPQNSVQNPGLEIFRALLCVRKRAFPFTVIYMFSLMFCPLEAAIAADREWGVWGGAKPPHGDAAGRRLGICLGTPPRLGRDKIES